MAAHLAFLAISAVICTVSLASDPDSMGDFCVGDLQGSVLMNGAACKDPKAVTEQDFFMAGFDKFGNTSNPFCSKVTLVNAGIIPGLNTLGVSMARIDLGPFGVNPPHTHPRASEIITVVEGSAQVGFITSNPEHRHFTKNLQKGDVFVFPMGLVHYQKNLADKPASILCAFNSQNPGTISLNSALFGAKPDIAEDILAKSLQANPLLIREIMQKF